MKDALQLNHIAQIKCVACVVLRNDEQVLGFRANFFNGRLGRLHGQWQHLCGQIVPTTWKQIGINGCQLETCVANVHRGVNGRRVLHPLQPEPTFDGGHGVKNPLLKFVDRAIQGRD